MCVPQALALIPGMAGAGAATAAGATAGAATLAKLGTFVSMGGTALQAVSQFSAARATRKQIGEQRRQEAAIAAVEDQRGRRRFLSAIRQQSAELMKRGISLDSPTAIALGQLAGQEMSYDSQAVRAGAEARDQELSGQQRLLRARGTNAILKGGFSAAGTLLEDAPDIWPELYA